MWKKVIFFGSSINAWVPPTDLWNLLTNIPQPSLLHTLAQVADDAPYRWLLLA